jgi:DNA-directed RNA polymerase specialized sigma24 family protein
MFSARGSSEYEPIAGAIREAIAALPGGQAQVVLLKLVRGLTFAEIGVATGLTEAAAKMRFVRALERLRAELSERGVEP